MPELKGQFTIPGKEAKLIVISKQTYPLPSYIVRGASKTNDLNMTWSPVTFYENTYMSINNSNNTNNLCTLILNE